MSLTFATAGMRWCRRGSLLLSFVLLSGCHWLMPKARPVEPTPCVLREGMTASEVVAHVNRNNHNLHAWQAMDAKIHATGPGTIPIKLKATVAVETPRKFRLVAASPVGNEADIGSNDERFWFWMKRSQQPNVFTVSHQQLPEVQEMFAVPFQPDWLMEAMGVVAVNGQDCELEPTDQTATYYRLVSRQMLPNKRVVERVIDVDRVSGNVIRQSMYDDQKQLLACARFREHKPCEKSGIVMPHHIEFDFPQTGMGMVMEFEKININPHNLSQNTFALPNIPNSPIFDVGEQIARMKQLQQLQQPSAPQGLPPGYLPEQTAQRERPQPLIDDVNHQHSELPPWGQEPPKQQTEQQEIPPFAQHPY